MMRRQREYDFVECDGRGGGNYIRIPDVWRCQNSYDVPTGKEWSYCQGVHRLTVYTWNGSNPSISGITIWNYCHLSDTPGAGPSDLHKTSICPSFNNTDNRYWVDIQKTSQR